MITIHQPKLANEVNQITIVALHGNGGGAFRFELIKPYLPPEINFQAITLPGFASIPADSSLQSLTDYAHYLSKQLYCYSPPLVLLGHGIGGTIALEFVQHFAHQIQGLILHAPVGTRLAQRFFPWLMSLPGARPLGQWLFSARFARPIFRRLLFSTPIPADFINRFFDEYRQCAVFAQMFDMITPQWFNSLQPIDIPSILLWGGQERILAVDQAPDYQRLLPQSSLEIMPSWDHFPMIEQPQEYALKISLLAQQLVI